ncbi:MAG: hypothetical protein MJB12_00920 [Firmicutes bacterium]|nr:hypothetical protein [Bacillota bacterium]
MERKIDFKQLQNNEHEYVSDWKISQMVGEMQSKKYEDKKQRSKEAKPNRFLNQK